MKSISGYDASGLPFVAGAPSRQTDSMSTTAPGESVLAKSSKTPSHSSTTCAPSEMSVKLSDKNLKSTGSTMTKDMNAATCGGQPGANRFSTLGGLFGSTTGTIRTSCSRTSSGSIARWVCAVLRCCITRVSRWTRLLEERAAVRANRGIPVYDIIEAGPRHRFWTVSIPCSNCVLGLGYGMGAAKFVDSCKSQGLDLPSLPKAEWPELDRRLMFMIRNVARIKGDPFSEKNEKKVGQLLHSLRTVEAWRGANRLIVDKWREYENVFKSRVAAGKETVAFRLPSGRVKRYFDPHLAKEPTVEIDENGVEHPSYRIAMKACYVRGEAPHFMTGGSIMENIVQASCRDIMTYGCLEIEEKHPNWKFVFSVYDEVIFEVPEDEADDAAVEVPRIMTKGERVSGWTQGMPLEVEGGIVDRYCK